MAVGLLLLIIVGLVVALVVFGVVGSALSPSARDNRSEIREARAEALAAKQREKIATKGLRAIVNGAGNPIFEAQDALDQIENTYIKELNS